VGDKEFRHLETFLPGDRSFITRIVLVDAEHGDVGDGGDVGPP